MVSGSYKIGQQRFYPLVEDPATITFKLMYPQNMTCKFLSSSNSKKTKEGNHNYVSTERDYDNVKIREHPSGKTAVRTLPFFVTPTNQGSDGKGYMSITFQLKNKKSEKYTVCIPYAVGNVN